MNFSLLILVLGFILFASYIICSLFVDIFRGDCKCSYTEPWYVLLLLLVFSLLILCCFLWANKLIDWFIDWLKFNSEVSHTHTIYTIEIGSNCNFQVSQGSVATQLRCDGRPCNRLFRSECVGERIMKIGLHLSKLWSKVSRFVWFCIGFF